jgi:hypothetical protein
MALVGPTQCDAQWSLVLASFDKQDETLITKNPDATHKTDLVRTAFVKIEQLIQISAQQNGNSITWKRLIDKAENEKNVLCKHVNRKALFTGMLRLYAAIHRELKDSLLPKCDQEKEEEAPHSRRRKRNSNHDDGSSNRKMQGTDKSRPLPLYQKPRPVVTKNFFAPLRAAPMEGAEVCDERSSSNDNPDKGRPPPLVLSSEANILSLQKDLKTVVTGEFFFRNTASGTRITTKSMADYKATQNLLSQRGLTYFTFYTKGDKPVKLSLGICRITLLPKTQELGYEVISVKQMTAKRPSQVGGVSLVTPPLFLVTLVRNQKSQEIFKISNLCIITVKVDRCLQVQKWSDPMLQLPALWQHLGPLQAGSSLPVVRGWSPPPRMSGGGEHPEYPRLLQLYVERCGITPSNQLQGLQSCKGGAAA